MDPKKAYKFCLRCSGNLAFIENNELRCKSCGFKYHINPIPSNAVILENKNGDILLVKRKFAPKKGWWDLPGGFIQPNESLEESVEREIKEELGIEVGMIKLVGIYPDTYLYQEILEPTLTPVVSAKIISGTIKAADDVSGYKFFSKSKVLKQKIAFDAAINGLRDYLELKSST